MEVLSGLRRPVRAGEVMAERAEEAIEHLGLLRIIRHGHLNLATRTWDLRENFTAYDAVYLALAESLDATVVTCDGPFGAAPGSWPGSKWSGQRLITNDAGPRRDTGQAATGPRPSPAPAHECMEDSGARRVAKPETQAAASRT